MPTKEFAAAKEELLDMEFDENEFFSEAIATEDGKVIAQPEPEAPELEVEETEPAPVETPAEVAARARDDKGKFVKSAPAAAPAPVAAATVAAPAAVAPPAEVTEPETPDEPWTFNGFNAPVSIEGARHKPGVGAFIPEASLGQARLLIARGTRYDDLKAERDSFKDAVSKTSVEAAALHRVLSPLLKVETLQSWGIPAEKADSIVKGLQLQAMQEERNIASGVNIVDDARLTGSDTPEQDFHRQEHLDIMLGSALARPEVASVVKAHPAVRARLAQGLQEFRSLFFGAQPNGRDGFKDQAFWRFIARELQPYAERPAAPMAHTPAPAPTRPAAQITAPPSPAGKVAPAGKPVASAPVTSKSSPTRTLARNKPWKADMDAIERDARAEMV